MRILKFLILKSFSLKNLFFFKFIFFLLIFAAKSENMNCMKIDANKTNDNENILPYKILVDVKNNRKFQKNNLRILTRIGTIKKKFKKRYSSTITVYYENKICKHQARIRIHGDFKDHIKLTNGNVIQSLDVHLKEGNISGITKFKLLLPETRKNPQDEILITEIFRALNVLAPRTFFVEVDNKSNKYISIFQEKTEKEFLEFNNRKESVILEGDERYIFDDDNNSFGWESKLFSLARVSNDSLFQKSSAYKNIIFNSLSNLNEFYLDTKNFYQKYGLFDYDVSKINDGYLNKSNLSSQNNKFEIFNSLIFSANAQHALIPHNRKFYWNKEYQTFEPIYYDGNIDILKEVDTKTFPINNNFFQGVALTLKKLNNLEDTILIEKVLKNLNVIDYKKDEIFFKFEKIKSNLSKIMSHQKNINIDLSRNQKSNYDKNLKKFFINIDRSKIVPIFSNKKFDKFFTCNLESCAEINFSDNELNLLTSGNLKKHEKFYQYVGINNFNIKDINQKNLLKKKYDEYEFKNSKIIYKKEEYFINEFNEHTLEIKQLIPNTRLIITEGELKDIKIIANFIPQNKNLNNKTFGPKGLTGCLNLIDIKIKDLIIESFNGNCEDSINIIRSKGSIKYLKILDSSNDGLDIDFSEIEIFNMQMQSAGNDCVDLSYGNYSVFKSKIQDCGDKGISVGEKSLLLIEDLNVLNSNIGLASKDGSKSFINNGKFENLDTCLSAYNKKQEFSGGFIKINQFNCNQSNNETFIDKASIINVNN